MRAVVVSKFGVSNRICPSGRAISTEDSKVCFYFLVDSFRFSISLGMVGGRESEVILEDSA